MTSLKTKQGGKTFVLPAVLLRQVALSLRGPLTDEAPSLLVSLGPPEGPCYRWELNATFKRSRMRQPARPQRAFNIGACVRRKKPGWHGPASRWNSGAVLSDSCQPQSALVLTAGRQLFQNQRHIKRRHPLSDFTPNISRVSGTESWVCFSSQWPRTVCHWELPSIMTCHYCWQLESLTQLQDKWSHWLAHKRIWTICINYHIISLQ